AGTCSGSSAFFEIYPFTGVSPGDYVFYWRATDAAGNLDFGAFRTVKILSPPSSPSNLQGVSSCGAGSNNPDINLTWTDNSDNEDGFKIYRGTVSGFTPTDPPLATVAANTNSYTDTSPLAGNTYHYKIKAYNVAGESVDASSPGISLAADFCKPTFVLTPSTASIPVGGTKQFDGTYDSDGAGGSAVPATPSRVSITWSSLNASIATVDSSSGLATGVSGGTATIQGIYSGLTSSASLRVASLSVSLSASPNSGTAPLNGVDLTATVSGTAVGTINYKFDCTNDGIWDSQINNSSLNPYTAVDVCNYASAGTYTAKVRVERDVANLAENTAGITVTVPPPIAPSGLGGVSVCAGSNNPDIFLAWTDNSNNEDGFKLYRSTTSGFIPADPPLATLSANTTSYTDTSPSAGTAYYYKIKAYNAGGDSGYSAQASAVAGTCAPTFILTPSAASIPVGGTKQFDGEYDPDGPSGSAASGAVSRTSITWSSNNTSIATVNASGLASGVSAGAATIKGIYSSIEATALLNVSDFSLSLSPTIIKSPRTGASQPSTITLTSLNGFNSAVTLSVVSGLPAGATANLSPVSVTPTASSIFSVTTSGVTAGSYVLTVQASGGGITKTTTITLNVVDLTITLSANPNYGMGSLTTSLSATIGGAAVGSVNLKIHCNSPASPSSWEHSFEGASSIYLPSTDASAFNQSDSQGHTHLIQRLTNDTVVIYNVCSYSSAGSYTPRARVERDVANPAEATGAVTVSDFSLSQSLDIIKAPKSGTSQSSVITVSSLSGFNSLVTLSVTAGLPSGATANFSPSSVTPPASGAITSAFSVNTVNVAAGNYSLTVQGSGGGLIRTRTVTLKVVDLSVALSANPNFGVAPINGVDLTATVSGTAEGTINYKFDCTNDGIWDSQINNSSLNPYAAVDVCNYASAGTYTAKVRVERDVANLAETTTIITTGNLPDTTINSGPANPTNQNAASFTFSGTNSPTAYWCKLDGSAWSPTCTTPKSYTVAQGSHIFQVKAVNSFGEDPIPASYTWLVDTEDPQISAFNVAPVNLNIDIPETTVSWTASDTGGSHLSVANVWRANYSPTCSETVYSGCAWQLLAVKNAPAASDGPWSEFVKDSPPDGVYWYGLHIKDNAGWDTAEGDWGFSAIKVTVDKTRPPKSVCNPAGGTFLNSVSVSCSNTEAGAITRYTTNGTSPNVSSAQYTGALNITSSLTLTVASWDGAGNRSLTPDNSYPFIIILNQAPSISSVSDSPDPVSPYAVSWIGNKVNFSADWSDPDVGDQTKLHLCKTNAISGQTCSGGSWCDTATWSGASPATCSYTTLAADKGTKDYYAFICDDDNACSASKSGTFLVDPEMPKITVFTVSPTSLNVANPKTTISWTVSDTGGSHLWYLNVFRRTGDTGSWDVINTSNAPTDSDGPWSNFYEDSPPDGTYYYGIHIMDKAGNDSNEGGAVKVTVDKSAPSTSVTSPANGSWQKDDFSAVISDSDPPGGSGLAIGSNSCFYRVDDLNSGKTTGDLTRACAISGSITKNVAVGTAPSDICSEDKIGVIGETTCKVSTKSFDAAGNDSGWKSRNFKIDQTNPTVGTASLTTTPAEQGKEETFQTNISDSLGKIAGCWFYEDSWTTPVAAPVAFSPITCENGVSCTASVNYTLPSFGSHQYRFACQDEAGNYGWGAPLSLSVSQNHVPQITSGPSYTTSPCASPTTQSGCLVSFSVTATDADNDNLGYSWDLNGDGIHDSSLREPTSYYTTVGPRGVTVKILDGRGGLASGLVNVPVTAPTLQADLTADPNSGVYPLNGVDLIATVSGTMYGTINYKFDCASDGWDHNFNGIDIGATDASAVNRTDSQGHTHSTQRLSGGVFKAYDLCNYPAAGVYVVQVLAERGSGSYTSSAIVNVSANSPPAAAISVDYSLCGPGANTNTAYTRCIFRLNNVSTDPNGLSDIKKSTWTIKEKATDSIKDTSICLAGNPLCGWSLLATIPAGTYIAQLLAEDLSGVQSLATKEFTVREDIAADFLCSLDNINWKKCDDSKFKPAKGGKIYFSDNLSDSVLSGIGLAGRKSLRSEGSSGIITRTWKKDGVIFSGTNNPNPSSVIQGTIIELTAEDDVGRSDSQSYDIKTQLPIPEWQEISPF
ncbi:MAG: Ig-like domain-containing protein, partial [bacterium]|nr:Ig-like domain-containing protein [bacterium]